MIGEAKLKSLSGAKVLKELSFEVLKNLYGNDRKSRKKKFRLISGKMVHRCVKRYRLLGIKKHECVRCGEKATHCFLTVNEQNRFIIEVGFLQNNKFIPLTVDHIIPKSQGGAWSDINNQQLLCHPCNSIHKNNEDMKKNGKIYKGWFVIGERSFSMHTVRWNKPVHVTHLTFNNPPSVAQPSFVSYVTGEVPSFVKVTK